MPASGGPPGLHRHPSAEVYRVEAGELCLYVEDAGGTVERIVAGPGEVVHIAGGRAHTIRNEAAEEARAYVVFVPGFARAAAPLAAAGPPRAGARPRAPRPRRLGARRSGGGGYARLAWPPPRPGPAPPRACVVPTARAPACAGAAKAAASSTSTPTASGSRSPRSSTRIQELVIPPAWDEVWICPYPGGHIQATGLDDARPQAVPLPPALARAPGPGEVRGHGRVRPDAARPAQAHRARDGARRHEPRARARLRRAPARPRLLPRRRRGLRRHEPVLRPRDDPQGARPPARGRRCTSTTRPRAASARSARSSTRSWPTPSSG